MYNFYPGPSKVYPALKGFAQEAFESGILEKNHRSGDFMLLLEQCTVLLRAHLNIPSDYKVFFTSSATECWEICAQSLWSGSVRFYSNGAFGDKWMSYSSRIYNQVSGRSFELNQTFSFEDDFQGDACVVASETSNGTHINPDILNSYSGSGLLFIDAVSSLGGVNYDISKGDVWISSSQKCFGLPSGMGILVVSPRAIRRAKAVNDNSYYNSVLFLEKNFDAFQTPYTPNILGIFLLKRLLESLNPIDGIAERIRSRADRLYQYFDASDKYSVLADNPQVRSATVIAFQCSDLKGLMNFLREHEVILGAGYGKWKESSVRIANFPAIDDSEYDYLCDLLTTFASK